jgi:mRNA-degrading endonuclease YafQ of YafQ-DinJ toxin-antitoxin module
MARKAIKHTSSPTVSAASAPITFSLGPEFGSTFQAFKRAGVGDRLTKALDKFRLSKETAPTVPYGSSDKPFRGDGHFSGLSHAHLTHDISLVYRYDRSSNQFKLYGFFKHDDLGTGTPPNLRKQSSVGSRLTTQVFEQG